MTLDQTRFAVSAILFAMFCAGPVVAGERAMPVTAVVLPAGDYSKAAVREMGREAGHLLKQSGVSLRWRIGIPPQSVTGLLVVVKLVGDCDMDGGSATHLVPGPLGWSEETNGIVLPFSNIACDNLRGAVNSAVLEGDTVHSNLTLGRAMGRVLAHELYHVIAGTSDHSSRGVAQATLSPGELTTGTLQFQQSDTKAIENGLDAAR